MPNVRRTFIIIVFLFICADSRAQSYHRILENIGWCVEQYLGTGSVLTSFTYDKDTVINNVSYGIITYNSGTQHLIREDSVNKLAWVILPDSTSETLIYDFSLVKGSQVTLNYVDHGQVIYQVDSVDTISTVLGTRQRTILSTSDTSLLQYLIWIEGIGSSYGPIYLKYPTLSIGQFGGMGYCLVCSYNSQGVQSYFARCGIPCGAPNSSACSFIGINETEQFKPVFQSKYLTPDLIQITLPNNKIKSMRIVSIEGKLIDQRTYDLNKKNIQVSTARWDSGFYLIKVITHDGKSVTGRLIKY